MPLEHKASQMIHSDLRESAHPLKLLMEINSGAQCGRNERQDSTTLKEHYIRDAKITPSQYRNGTINRSTLTDF